MKYLIKGGFIALTAMGATQASGQSVIVAPAAPTAAIAPIAPNNAVLRSGTEIGVRLLEELTTKGKNLRIGNRFRIETSDPVVVQGVTVIPAGSPGVGEITDIRNKGMWGKSGRLAARLLYVTVNGRQIRIAGGFDDKGVAGGIGATAVAALVFLPAGFFMTGTSAVVPAGTVIKGFIDEDVPLAMPAQAFVPLQVPPAAAALPVAAPAMPVAGPAVTAEKQ